MGYFTINWYVIRWLNNVQGSLNSSLENCAGEASWDIEWNFSGREATQPQDTANQTQCCCECVVWPRAQHFRHTQKNVPGTSGAGMSARCIIWSTTLSQFYEHSHANILFVFTTEKARKFRPDTGSGWLGCLNFIRARQNARPITYGASRFSCLASRLFSSVTWPTSRRDRKFPWDK